MPERHAMTLHRLKQMHALGEKISMLTCYDAAFAGLLDEAGVDVLLVGDSLGMVVQGHATTLPVTMAQSVYHTECVARSARSAWIITDMPFGSYQGSIDQAVENAALLMKAGAHMVKLEGGSWVAPLVRALVERGIPVCGHLGFTPQSVFSLGGYRVQGRDTAAVHTLHADAAALEAAGAAMLVLELLPSAVARTLTTALSIPVIGIGAGSGCSGQVLVLHDMLNVSGGRQPRFVRNFMQGQTDIRGAVQSYVKDVKSGHFPDDSLHGY
jgi:3-methyl-2-oxobutanoate hydroxymethyltransferase